MTRHYLDYASTAPLRPVARHAITQALDVPAGDPSRIHTEALTVRYMLELARQSIAEFVGAKSREVVITSSATEAITSVIWGVANDASTVIATAVEHSSVRESATAAGELITVGVDRTGRVDPAEFAAAVDAAQEAGKQISVLVCQWINHEVGTIQPVTEIIEIGKDRGVPVLIDASQAVGFLPVDFANLGADFVAFSGHKLGGPTGSGVLLIRQGLRIRPLLRGGSQERARRAGLENTISVVGLGAACAELGTTMTAESADALRHTDRLRSILKTVKGVEILGPATMDHRAPHIVCATLPEMEPQAVLLLLDQAGVAAHSGSACAAEDIEPSPILQAMGIEAHRSLRLSVGWNTTDDDIDAFEKTFESAVQKLQDLR